MTTPKNVRLLQFCCGNVGVMSEKELYNALKPCERKKLNRMALLVQQIAERRKARLFIKVRKKA